MITDDIQGTPVIVMDFSDGREAQYRQKRSSVRWASMRMDLTETLCIASQSPVRCDLLLPLMVMDGAFVWTKHADASKIGKEVRYDAGDGRGQQAIADQQGLFFMSIEESQRIGTSLLAAHRGQLVCDKYEWLTSQPNTPGGGIPKWMSITSWSGETNTATEETGVAENQAVNGGFDLQLTAVNGRIYQIDSARFFSMFAGNPALVSQGPATLVTRDTRGELCQTTFSMSLGKTNTLINELRDELKTAGTVIGRFPRDVFSRIERTVKSLSDSSAGDDFKGSFE